MSAAPGADRVVGARHPVQLRLTDEDRDAAERAAPLHLRAEHVRVAAAIAQHLPLGADALHGRLVDIADRVPQQTALRRADQMGLMADPDLGLGRDPEQPGLHLMHPGLAARPRRARRASSSAVRPRAPTGARRRRSRTRPAVRRARLHRWRIARRWRGSRRTAFQIGAWSARRSPLSAPLTGGNGASIVARTASELGESGSMHARHAAVGPGPDDEARRSARGRAPGGGAGTGGGVPARSRASRRSAASCLSRDLLGGEFRGLRRTPISRTQPGFGDSRSRW